MRFLISTHKGLYEASESGECREWSQGYYYSTVLIPKDQVILSVRRVNPWTKDSRSVAEIFDLSGRRLFGPGPDLTEVRDPHQGLFHEDTLYLTNAHEDKIQWFDFGPSKRSGEKVFEEEDMISPNSITRNPDGFLVGFHNRSKVNSRVAWLDDDMEIQRTIDLPDEGIHNILEDSEGRLIYNASEAGEVVRYDPESGYRESLGFEIDVHTKGMTHQGSLLISGASDSEVTLDQRFRSRSWLVLTDLTEWKIRETVPLMLGDYQSVANVNEVMVLDE